MDKREQRIYRPIDLKDYLTEEQIDQLVSEMKLGDLEGNGFFEIHLTFSNGHPHFIKRVVSNRFMHRQ